MEIFQIVAIGMVAAVLSVLIKNQKPEIGIYISLATGIIIFIFIVAKLQSVIEILNQLANKINIDDIYLSTILKIVGIAYIAEFGAQVCKDAGEGVIASKIEFAGKILIMVMSVPILVSLMDLIINIVP
ncbi:stage III sporulation protein AD [Clostridium formicaceticum]|uniref:Stage III sporulation protein AC/AD protein family protein n=1 Tax=Clostridium formicaceticum TaxID=1497 RepID=A0AAC9WG38_9CLOT|nr:stage III sporulation protein AD [Clostridium formicaceticum]AOY77063.1 stage III sporulation protein AD [Clostridium formicaceticum]ARE87567.1 Stage III sporulation protein AC/AD protein family protein [Clostridium formicaceticum]